MSIIATTTFIPTLEHQRNYETHVKFIDLAKQMDEGGASLMRVPD